MISSKDYPHLATIVCLWAAILLPPVVDGYLNIFINQKEMMKLMGLDAELFYVRNGVVNTYAMIFVVPVPADVFSLEFSWQSLTEFPLRYRVIIEYESQLGGLLSPQLNIPDRGYVPISLETFTIHLPCSGNVSEEVPLGINLFIDGSPNFNNTHMTFKRNKICLKNLYANSPAPAIALSQGPAILGAAACALGLTLIVGLIASAVYMRARKQQESLNTSYATTSVYGSHQNVFVHIEQMGRRSSVNSGSYATIASLNKFPLTEGYSKKSWYPTSSPTPTPYATANLVPVTNNSRQLMVHETTYAKPESMSPSHVSYYAYSQLNQLFGGSASPLLSTRFTPQNTNRSTPSNFVFSELSSNRSASRLGQQLMTHTQDKWKQLEVPSGAIECKKLIREGTYGRIYVGTLLANDCNIKSTANSCADGHRPITNVKEECLDVLIKTVMDGASLTQVAFLLSEGSKFAGVSHQNLHSPLAVSMTVPCSPAPKIAYPFATGINLKTFLQSCRDNKNSSPNTQVLVNYGLQLAKAVEHLHSIGILHGDIGTRNCVLDGAHQVVRLGDSALSRDLFPEDYHCLGDNENRPIKWLALETLQKKSTVCASDCWSFGVLLWELVTLAAMPYEEVDCFELEGFLSDGYRLEHPVNCPDEFYTVMTCCWLEDHSQRPSFPQLVAYLQDFHEDLGKYI